MTFVTRYIVFEKGKLQTVKQKQKIFDENHETWQLGIMKVPISIHCILFYCAILDISKTDFLSFTFGSYIGHVAVWLPVKIVQKVCKRLCLSSGFRSSI